MQKYGNGSKRPMSTRAEIARYPYRSILLCADRRMALGKSGTEMLASKGILSTRLQGNLGVELAT